MHPVVVLLRERVELVVVALRAAERAAQPDGARWCSRGRPAVSKRASSTSMPPSWLSWRVAVEAGGDLLLDGRVLQHVARDLLDREVAERQVAVERVDHPVAVLPGGAALVLLVAVACRRSARGRARDAPSARRSAARRAAGRRPSRRRPGSCRPGRRRSPAGVGGRPTRSRLSAPDQRLARGLGRRREASLLQPRQHEGVDRVLRTQPALAHARKRRPHRLHVGPVLRGLGRRGASSGPAAPASIQAAMRAISAPASGGFLRKGMRGVRPGPAGAGRAGSRWLLPGTITLPESPPSAPAARVEAQLALLLLRPVAGDAVRLEDRRGCRARSPAPAARPRRPRASARPARRARTPRRTTAP